MSTTRAVVRMTLFVGLTLPLMPVQWLLVRCGSRAATRLPMHYHRLVCRIVGLEVVRHGTHAADPPVLFVANHASWLDIPVLSAVAPISFIAKHEVAGWPFFGTLARLQRTVFVERRAARTATHRDEIAARLEARDNLVLFAEGTSSDGNRVLPFKSALFAVAERQVDGRPLTVQPVSIAYTALDGLPLGRRLRHYYAWFGEMELVPHLWQVLKLGRGRVELLFHPPVSMAEFADRKTLAQHCEAAIGAGLARALSGRARPAAADAAAAGPASAVAPPVQGVVREP